MKLRKRIRCPVLVLLLGLGSYSQLHAAASYPDRPARMIVPLATGGGMDIVARLFAQKLSDNWGQQVVVDNRPGAGGVIGTELAAKAAPDGYTLVWVSSSHVVLPSVYKNLPYDTVRDFSTVSMLVTYPFILVAHPSVAAKNVNELIALARTKPAQLSYSSAGSGSTSHLAAELIKSLSAADITHVPYKGSGPAITGLLSGEVSIGFFSSSATLQHVKAGRLNALATTGETRSPMSPHLPTVSESGVPGYEASTWGGILFPAATPFPIISRLHSELLRVLRQPEVKDRLATLEAQAVGNSPSEFAAIIDKELVKWRKVVRASGAKVD